MAETGETELTTTTTTNNNSNHTDYNRAISYVSEIKRRFQETPQRYFAFLDLLHSYQQNRWSLSRVLEEAVTLFAPHHLDLLQGLLKFFPDATHCQGCDKLLCLVTKKYQCYIQNACKEHIMPGIQNFNILKLPENMADGGRHMLEYYWRTASCLVTDVFESSKRRHDQDMLLNASTNHTSNNSYEKEVWMMGSNSRSTTKKSIFMPSYSCANEQMNIIQKMMILDNCPPLLLRLAIRVHPELLMRALDEHSFDKQEQGAVNGVGSSCCSTSGSYILHMAASMKKGVMCSEAAGDIFGDLCQIYPNASHTPDVTGRVPLALAISSGKPFHQGIQQLLNAKPQLLTEIDPVTGLYPFMMAALSLSLDHTKEAVTSVNTTYRLLRECPELSHYHRNTSSTL